MENVFGLNSGTMVEMWLNNTQIYSNTLWYGIKFSGSSPDGTRVGNIYMHKTLPVQSNFKACTLTQDGDPKYLNPNDWTKYEDGASIDTSLDIMIEIPSHSINLVPESDGFTIQMSPYLLPGFTEVKKQYVGAYEGLVQEGRLRSTYGVVPTVSTTRESFQSYARANGSAHWNMYTYEAHKAITWCFVVEYATLNSQKGVISSLTSEGYHQGGLGSGCTAGTVGGAWAFMNCGTSDSLGTSSGEVAWTNGTDTRMCNRYRGIENPFGHVWKNTIDVIWAGTSNRIYKCNDFLKFGNDKSLYTDTGINDSTTEGSLSKLVNNPQADLFCAENSGSSTTYFCDYHWTNPVDVDRTLLIGGSAVNGVTAGFFALDSHLALGGSSAAVGTRLVYLP